MIWSAARLFHGRPVLWGAMCAGAIVWLFACLFPDFVQWAAARIVLSSLIVSTYTFLTAAELWRERRKTLLRRWPAIFVPILHGAVFLFPIPLASLLPADGGMVSLASGWIAVFALETMLYVVGTAFIVLVLAKERSVRIHRDAASTDEMTGLLNRRGFFAAAHQLVARQAKKGEPVSVLMFDLDHFKSINDRFGHRGRRRGAQASFAVGRERQHACGRRGRALRRRGVRRHAARHARRRHGRGRARAPRLRGGRRQGRRLPSSTRRSASASPRGGMRCRLADRDAPTPRSTAPRATAATASRASSRACRPAAPARLSRSTPKAASPGTSMARATGRAGSGLLTLRQASAALCGPGRGCNPPFTGPA